MLCFVWFFLILLIWWYIYYISLQHFYKELYLFEEQPFIFFSLLLSSHVMP